MFNFGAFAGGLAQGIRSGGELGLKGRLAERAAKADERAAEMHHARMDKAAFNKDQRERLRAANDEIAAGWREAPQPSRPMATSPDQLRSDSARLLEPAETDPVLERPNGQFSMGGLQSKSAARTESGATASLDGADLMSQYKNFPITQKNPPQSPMAADEMIGRRMLTGNLLEDADELTRMASIYKKHGLLKEMMPWMNKAYEAKKKRIPDALHFLLTGDAKAAREILKKGGISLIDDPAPTDPNDPQNHHWKFKLENGGEQDINLKECRPVSSLLQFFLNKLSVSLAFRFFEQFDRCPNMGSTIPPPMSCIYHTGYQWFYPDSNSARSSHAYAFRCLWVNL